MNFNNLGLSVLMTLGAMGSLWAMEERSFPLQVEDIYGRTQTVELGKKMSPEGKKIEVVNGTLKFHDGSEQTFNNTPLGQFKKVIGRFGQMFLTKDIIPAGEPERVERQAKTIPNETDTMALNDKLVHIQKRIKELSARLARVTDPMQRMQIQEQYRDIMKQLDPILEGRLINGSEDEIDYLLSKAISLYVLAWKGYGFPSVMEYFINREPTIAGHVRIDVSPWFDYLKRQLERRS